MPWVPVRTYAPGLLEQLEITAREIEQRKSFLEFGVEDIQALKSINRLAEQYADDIIEDCYRHLLSFEEAQSYIRDPQMVDYVKRRQREYFLGLTSGEYDMHYVAERLAIGAVHERIGLPMKL